MCLIVFSYKNHSKYPFIFAGNRDEFYSRPTRTAHFWDTKPQILAGKDLKAGGTWLGISKTGEFAALTNYRDLNHPRNREKSRGELIPYILTTSEPEKQAVKNIISNGDQYDGFNMIAGNTDKLFYLSNIRESYEPIKPGVYGLSNAFLDTPWPKTEQSKKDFSNAILGNNPDEEAIFRFLKNPKTYPSDQLPNTGLTPEMEKAISPVFIETDKYGTRCSTLLMIDNNGQVTFIERTFPVDEQNSETEKRFQFKIKS